MKKGKTGYVILIAVAILLLGQFFKLFDLYAEWLFFAETGFTAIFIKILTTQALTAGVSGGVFLFFALANLMIAHRFSFPRRNLFIPGLTAHPLAQIDPEKIVRPLGYAVVFLMAFFISLWGASRWEDFLLFQNSVDLRIQDPILGKDIGFYLFRLRLIEMVQGFISFSLVLVFIVVAAGYLFRGGVVLTERGVFLDASAKKHLGILAALFALNIGFGFYLDTFRLLYSELGAVHGAGYTDIHAKLLTYKILALLLPVAGIAFAIGIWRGSRLWTLIPPALIVAVYGIGIALYPALLQKFVVAPNELVMESPFIANNIKYTRMGYDLDRIQVIPFDADDRLTAQDIAKNNATIKNIRLWDQGPLLRTYSQLQQIRTYYRFADVDNDRYTIGGEYMQVMLSPRELSYNDLPSKTWINERLIFTHGNGIALGPVSRISKEGLPEFLIKDIPPTSQVDLKITRPEIYYGELSNNYVVVKTKMREFSYPTSNDNVYTTYEGKGGIPINSLLRRLLFSLVFKTEKILLSSDITKESRILYQRNINERIRTIAPFLQFENDGYLVITPEGRLVWIIDAYTVSDRMPYSKPYSRKNPFNYIRNSVKATVDAYDGTVRFFVSDPEDKIIQVYAKIFPDTFLPLEQMPDGLRQHIRYPQQLLQMQSAMFAAYHMTDPKVFYNRENLWEVPVFGDTPMEPYYTIMKLPGEKKEEFLLLLPYTPAKRDNLAAWLAARCDGQNYGKLVVYTFPRERLIYGPKQVDARINQDSDISQQLTLWSQRGSQVIRGSLLVIPIERSLLYVQPLYLAASDKVGLPELRRVIVAYGNEVVMEENLDLALQRLFGAKKTIVETAAAVKQEVKTGAQDLVKEAMKAYEKAADELKRLEQILKKMSK